MGCSCTTASARTHARQQWRERSSSRRRPPSLSSSALAGEGLTVHELAYLVATGLGAVRAPSAAGWHFDRRHLAQGERLPMQFYARAVAPPAPLRSATGTLAVDADALHVPQLQNCNLAEHARAMLCFVESSTTPVLPDDTFPAALYWRMVSTDSCEASACGVLLTLRKLLLGMRIPLFVDKAGGGREPVVAFGMQTAIRIEPFTRHLMTPFDGCRVLSRDGCRVDALRADANLEVLLHNPRQP